MKIIALAAASLATLALAACDYSAPSADQRAAPQQEDIAKRAQAEVGIYQPTHFTRKRLANRIGQMLDDPALATISYAQGMDGKLRCIGHTIGFPLPAATQTTSPQKWEVAPRTVEPYTASEYHQVPQADPDQLFYPAEASATWILLVDAKTGQTSPAYFEGNVETFPADVHPDSSLIGQPCTQ